MATNSHLLSRRNQAVARGVASIHQRFAQHAENAEVWDVEGKRYIDFAGGIGVLNTGHRHPKVMAAVRAQMERFTHTCFQVMPCEPYVALAERLNALAPGGLGGTYAGSPLGCAAALAVLDVFEEEDILEGCLETLSAE